MAARIKKGDTVLVISGADRGKRGEVLRVMPADNRAVVQGFIAARRRRLLAVATANRVRRPLRSAPGSVG
jgi:ribosomal protein L24